MEDFLRHFSFSFASVFPFLGGILPFPQPLLFRAYPRQLLVKRRYTLFIVHSPRQSSLLVLPRRPPWTPNLSHSSAPFVRLGTVYFFLILTYMELLSFSPASISGFPSLCSPPLPRLAQSSPILVRLFSSVPPSHPRLFLWFTNLRVSVPFHETCLFLVPKA